MIKIFVVGFIFLVVSLVTLTAVDNNNKKTSGGNGGNVVDVNKKDGEKNVKIEGEINHPGSFSILPTETLGTLVQKAGGYTADADTYAIVEETPIGDFTEFYIPVKADDFCEPKPGIKININDESVTKEDMNKVFDIGATYCQSIIDYRVQNGPYVIINQLMNVKNIGKARFDKIKDKVTLK